MADFAGNVLASAIYTDKPTNPAIGNAVAPDYLTTWLAGAAIDGPRAITQPVDEPQIAKSGNHNATFAFLDWYNRIHVEPLNLDMGNILSEAERTISLWNAYFVARTLVSVTPSADSGLTLELPAEPPIQLAPLEQMLVTLQVSTEGPATIDAHYIFEFDVDEFDLHVVGVRIVAWPWEVNWISPLIERLEWATDVETSYDGHEQRLQLRGAPRGEWEFTFDVRDDQRRVFENVIFGWGARVWALPIWTDVELLEAPLVAGSTSIPMSRTAGRDYRTDGLGVIIGPDGEYEAIGVASVSADSITLQDPTLATWPIGSRVYPARPARLLDPRSTRRLHRNYARGIARFRSTDEIERDALSETLYRDLPVMERELNWRDAPDVEYTRKLETIDYSTGKTDVIDQSQLAIPVHRFIFTGMTRDDCDYLRAWLYARIGRCKGVWMPTWADDLKLYSAVASTATQMDVEACGLTHFAGSNPHRTDIRIELKSGDVYYRRVSDPSQPTEVNERLVLNAPFGVTITPDDVERISWLHFVRLDSDSVELTWHNQNFMEAMIALRGPRHDF